MNFHELSNIFPMMSEEEYASLKADISRNGLIEPIWLHEDKIIDGRNRFNACQELGVTPRFKTWDGKGSLVSFVVSLNLHRRHLNSSQRAVCAVEAEAVMERLRKEAEERMLRGTKANPTQKIAEGSGEVREQAAQLFQTNRQYVSDAKAIKESAPEKAREIKEGKKTIPQVKREIRLDNLSTREVSLPSKKYRIIYADPPWKYGDQLTEKYGPTRFHYPSMSIQELCDLPILGLSEDNAVLFLWATSPLLEECFPVIKAWGFKYKTSFVWDKISHNLGHYNSVRHEFLLICTRGSCLPDIPDLYDSVVSIERSKTHSEKPEEFRKMIDKLYTHGRRIELFARKAAEGEWETWGNQATDLTTRKS